MPGGVPVTGIISPLNSGDFPVNDPQFQISGFRVVADDTERDAITAERRAEGMWVYVTTSNITYRLDADLTTWIAVNANTPTYLQSYFVGLADIDPSAPRTGSISAPFGNLQEAFDTISGLGTIQFTLVVMSTAFDNLTIPDDFGGIVTLVGMAGPDPENSQFPVIIGNVNAGNSGILNLTNLFALSLTGSAGEETSVVVYGNGVAFNGVTLSGGNGIFTGCSFNSLTPALASSKLRDCIFSPGATIDGDDIQWDALTRHNARTNNCTVNPLVSMLDSIPFTSVFYVDSGQDITTPDGSPTAPYATLQAAVDARVAGTSNQVILIASNIDNSMNLTLNNAFSGILQIVGEGGYPTSSLPDTVTAQTFGTLACGSSTGDVILQNIGVNSITGSGANRIGAYDCVLGDVNVPAATFRADSSSLAAATVLTCASLELRNCSFGASDIPVTANGAMVLDTISERALGPIATVSGTAPFIQSLDTLYADWGPDSDQSLAFELSTDHGRIVYTTPVLTSARSLELLTGSSAARTATVDYWGCGQTLAVTDDSIIPVTIYTFATGKNVRAKFTWDTVAVKWKLLYVENLT